jgi:hypothetical protein
MTAAERLSALPSAQRQMLAVAILAAALALSWYAVLKPLHRLLTSQEVWRNEVRRDLAESRGKAAIESRVTAQFESLREIPLWGTFYPGASEEEANAQIQQDLRGLGAASGVAALALTPLPKKEYPDYIAYGIHVNGVMTAEQLKRFSAALRAAPHFLRVERFAASAPQTQSPNENPPVNVTLDIYGYSRAGAALPPPAARGSS